MGVGTCVRLHPVLLMIISLRHAAPTILINNGTHARTHSHNKTCLSSPVSGRVWPSPVFSPVLVQHSLLNLHVRGHHQPISLAP
ncbi:unnamed protein product [Mesocestoides corti]|uniref:Secreted protein n=1 Tax=Mesocestoides corti TaxID=53468 RepID=A0A0R3UGT8_MESCO|nr:unnamed protein product [Mesocestoides corti]